MQAAVLSLPPGVGRIADPLLTTAIGQLLAHLHPLPQADDLLFAAATFAPVPLPSSEQIVSHLPDRSRGVRSMCPPLAEAQRLLSTFRTILMTWQCERLDPWLEQCERSGISELVGFARGLRYDYAAVAAAMRYDWSQGPIEGHITRLKMLKRQMYGRANFPLLRRRVLADLERPP